MQARTTAELQSYTAGSVTQQNKTDQPSKDVSCPVPHTKVSPPYERKHIRPRISVLPIASLYTLFLFFAKVTNHVKGRDECGRCFSFVFRRPDRTEEGAKLAGCDRDGLHGGHLVGPAEHLVRGAADDASSRRELRAQAHQIRVDVAGCLPSFVDAPA